MAAGGYDVVAAGAVHRELASRDAGAPSRRTLERAIARELSPGARAYAGEGEAQPAARSPSFDAARQAGMRPVACRDDVVDKIGFSAEARPNREAI